MNPARCMGVATDLVAISGDTCHRRAVTLKDVQPLPRVAVPDLDGAIWRRAKGVESSIKM